MATTDPFGVHSSSQQQQQRPASSSIATAIPYPPLPASPTLTNPDMILPDYDRSTSPERSMSPLLLWKGGPNLADMQFHHLASQTVFAAGPVTPTTPIIYGNGTMLSDIGEVTEVESTVGRISRPVSPGFSEVGHDIHDPTRSSPTMGNRLVMNPASTALLSRVKPSNRPRSGSADSSSTVTTRDHAGLFADFDDTISVDDSNFQGDDEESVAEYFDDTSVPDPRFLRGTATAGTAEDGYSTASLSRRAERILASAKRRLTMMEGNLTRARSSLDEAPSLPSDGSTPSPPIIAPSPLSHSDPLSPGSSTGHSRMMSDYGLPTKSPLDDTPRRSASALGAAGGYRQPLSRGVDRATGGAGGPRSSHKATPLHTTIETNLEPLSEDDTATESAPPSASLTHDGAFLSPTSSVYSDRGLARSASAAQVRDLKDQMNDLKGKISSLREQARADSLKRRSLQSLRTPSPFTHSQVDQWYAEPERNPEPRPLPPQGATSPGRNPWNGELSSVDDNEPEVSKMHATALAGTEGDETPRTSVDMARRSSSGGSRTQEPERPTLSAVGGTLHAIGSPRDLQHEFAVQPENREGEEDLGDEVGEGEVDDDRDDMCTENGDVDEEDEEEDEEEEDFVDADVTISMTPEPAGMDDDGDDFSESGDSLYHDTLQTPLSHEDREDAFDYEHFFLHSAMGTISRDRLTRRKSFDSECSIETTRGPAAESRASQHGEMRSRGHSRRGSGDTISTMESFETATEGRSSWVGSRDGSKHDSMPPQPERPSTAGQVRLASRPSDEERWQQNGARRPRHNSVVYRPPGGSSMHRPSVSSFVSTGTNRSFPLVNKAKINNSGMLTPQGSPDQELKQISETLMSETASICEKQGTQDGTSAMHMLRKEDELLVGQLVASLGRSVLGLAEAAPDSAESRLFRRRIHAAKQILEGQIQIT